MAYRFKLNEGFAAGLRRIGEEQVERAMVQLASASPGVGVHETRRCVKRVRALLRLVRSGIGEVAFDRENARFRDIGRMLSGARDRAVMLATIDRLAAEQPSYRAALATLRRGVDAMPDAKGEVGRKLAQRVSDQLDAAKRDWHALELEPDELRPIAKGLGRGVCRLRTALEAANGTDDDAFHDWRKATQQHWRHMRLLQTGWPEYFEARALEAKTVSDLLGAAQDLTLLLARIEDGIEHRLRRVQVRSLREMVREQRGIQRDLARERCARLVAEGGDGLAKRCQSYWDAAGRLQVVEQQAAAAKPKPADGGPHSLEVSGEVVRPQRRQHAAVAATKGLASRRKQSRRPSDNKGGKR